MHSDVTMKDFSTPHNALLSPLPCEIFAWKNRRQHDSRTELSELPSYKSQRLKSADENARPVILLSFGYKHDFLFAPGTTKKDAVLNASARSDQM